MDNLGFGSILAGVFSADRKSAKAREMAITQAQYDMHQKKMQQQYQLSTSLAERSMQAAKIASAQTFRLKDAQGLAQSLDSVFDEMNRDVKERFGGNVMQYMIAEGNEKMTKAVANFEERMGVLEANRQQIIKFNEAANSDKAGLMFKGDAYQLQQYIDGKIDSFTYRGLKGEINMDDVTKNVATSEQIRPSHILQDPKNRNVILSNYAREYGKDPSAVTRAELEDYTYREYLESQPGLRGADETKRTIVGQWQQSSVQLRDRAVSNPFDQKAIDEHARDYSHLYASQRLDKSVQPPTKWGKKLSTTGAVFGGDEDKVYEAFFGSGYKEGRIILPSNQFYDEDGQRIEGPTFGGEFIGGHPDYYSIEPQGIFTAYKYTIDGKTQFAVLTDDEAKNAELKAALDRSGAKLTQTHVVAGIEKDTLNRDDVMYAEIDITDPTKMSELNNKFAEKGAIPVTEIYDRQKMQEHRDYNARSKKVYIDNLAKMHTFANPDTPYNLYEYTSSEVGPLFTAAGIGQEMTIPALSMLMTAAQDDNDVNNVYMPLLKRELQDPQSDLYKAFASGSSTNIINYLASGTGVMSFDSKQLAEFRQTMNDFTGLIQITQRN